MPVQNHNIIVYGLKVWIEMWLYFTTNVGITLKRFEMLLYQLVKKIVWNAAIVRCYMHVNSEVLQLFIVA